MYTLFCLLLIFVSAACQNFDGDIDANGPEPLIPHTSVDEPALVSLGNAGDCYCRELPGKMSVFYGNECRKFPKNISTRTPILKFRTTLVEIIKADDFQLLYNLTYIEIESNSLLYKLEPGCFRGMSKLTNLSISFNEKLSYLEENLFEGLFNLQEVYLRSNGFKNIIDITRALSPKLVPKLLTLVLNRNVLKKMSKNDFLPMEGTHLESLNLVLCQIDFIHPDVLKPLRNLTALRLGENLFNIDVLTNLLKRTLSYGIPLKILNLYEVGFRGNPPRDLLEIIAKSNITYLNLGRNHFERLTDHMFPSMPTLETLVLRDTVTSGISQNTFIGMTKLKYLVLSGNRLTFIHSGLLLRTLTFLDVSSNSYNSDSHFDIPNNIFVGMSALQKLQLSYNQIEAITSSTFKGLSNLIILELNNAQIGLIESGSFLHMKSLKRLNLENNYIGSDMIMIASLFEGLQNLQVLLLGGCHILNISSDESIFEHLPNLFYLGLQRNGLHVISSSQFLPVVNLNTIDLAENDLSPWDKQLFHGKNLKYLNVAQNKLLTITKEMLLDILHFEKVKVDGNPFSCDCSWYPMFSTLKSNISLQRSSIVTDSSAKCVSPEKWQRYTISEYLNFLNTTNDCVLMERSNDILLISVLTLFIFLLLSVMIMSYYYRWNIRYWLFLAQTEIARRSKLVKKIKAKSISDYTFTYDAFVSYSNEDKEFVDKLVTALENTEPYLKLCVYERDFQIGTFISESVVQNIAMSRRIVLIISDSFAKSQWCRWEMHLAECHQMSDESEDGLILIVKEKVSNKYMTPFLRYIMKSRIYLEWDTDETKVEDFWCRIKNTLSAGTNAI